MKKILILFISAIISMMSVQAQISVGVRDTRHVYGEYLLKNHYFFRLDQSIYSEKIGFQTLRADIGYTSTVSTLRYYGDAYFGSAYNGDYFITGVNIGVRYTAFGHLLLNGRLNPHYDSGIKYQTCFALGAGYIITKHIDILAAYSTIPEYRMSEKRIRGGFDFHTGSLSVIPEISVSVAGSNKAKGLRALMSFRYTF